MLYLLFQIYSFLYFQMIFLLPICFKNKNKTLHLFTLSAMSSSKMFCFVSFFFRILTIYISVTYNYYSNTCLKNDKKTKDKI